MTRNTNDLSTLFSQIPETLADTFQAIHSEVSEVGKTLVMSQLKSQDVVTRDEFELQKTVLADIAAKLAKIEKALVSNT